MKILVCISKTPETTAKISFTDNNTKFNTDGVQYIMNPYDEWYALVRAIELVEEHSGSVTTINVGPPTNDVIIRKSLAIGADVAIRINGEPGSAGNTAFQIASYARDKNYDLILLGKETIDYNGSEVGSMLAEHLDLPFISFASHLEYKDGASIISRDIEGGIEIVRIKGSCVISAAKGLAEQRIPNMRGIMTAKRKPLNVVEMADYSEKVTLKSFILPEEKGGVKLVDPENMDELVRLLHEEAKVI